MTPRLLVGMRIAPEVHERYADSAAITPGCDMRYNGETIGKVTRTWVEDGDLCLEAEIDPKFRHPIERGTKFDFKVVRRVVTVTDNRWSPPEQR